MTTFDTLPVILVSTANEADAATIISDLIDNDVTADYHSNPQSDRVWKLVNKYYMVNVRVHPLTDDGRLDVDPEAIEAHIIHVTEEELKASDAGVSAAEARAARGAGAAVRVLLADALGEPRALRGWAARARAVLLPRRAAAALRDARDALHAHAWRGLARTDRAPRPPRPPDSESSGEEDEAEAERRAVDHAETFAAALGALGEARAGGQAEGARLERAEALVAAFCRALGYDLDAC